MTNDEFEAAYETEEDEMFDSAFGTTGNPVYPTYDLALSALTADLASKRIATQEL